MKIFSVEELQNIIRNLIIGEFNYPISIKGEVANPRVSPRGHQYFTLRDGDGISQSSINCVIFNGQLDQNIKDYDTKEVLINGNIDLYKGNGNCQIKVADIAEYGEGEVKKSIEQTRLKLEKEGLFEHKKLLPKYPKCIGLITSPDSHALHDVCSKLKSRYPISNIIIYPSLVQGRYAPNNIIKQLIRCNKDKDVDLILLIRGGGSLEDLMAFNDENLAREIHASELPVVTGIGHQPDITISDYVADASLETPTAAAVYITPDQFELLQRIGDAEERIKSAIQLKVKYKNDQLLNRVMKIQNYNPSRIINNLKDTRNNIDKNYHNVVKNILNELNAKSAHQLIRLKQTKNILTEKVTSTTRSQKNTLNEMNQKIISIIANRTSTYRTLLNELVSYNPQEVLKKGYSIIRDLNGGLVKSRHDLDKIQSFSAEFKDGVTIVKKPSSIK